MKERILPESQDFLLSRSLVPEKNVSFYAYWVSKFLVFSNRNEDLGPDLRFQKLPDPSEILDEMREAIRIKHYSYGSVKRRFRMP